MLLQKNNRHNRRSSPYFQILLVMCSFTSLSEAKGPSKRHSTFYDYLTSSDFRCKIQSKRVFKPGTINESYDVSSVAPVCTVVLSCNPVAGITAKSFTASQECIAPEGTCEEPIDCAKRKLVENPKARLDGRVVKVASLADSANNKFGDVCWETSGIKDKRGVVQLLSDGKPAEEFCATVYVCRGRPIPTHASCPLRKESNQDVCPQLNDCINNDLTFPGYTESDLRLLTAEEREKIRNAYEAGGKILGARVKTSAPNKTSDRKK